MSGALYQQARDSDPTLVWCCAIVYDDGPTSGQRRVRVTCFQSVCQHGHHDPLSIITYILYDLYVCCHIYVGIVWYNILMQCVCSCYTLHIILSLPFVYPYHSVCLQLAVYSAMKHIQINSELIYKSNVISYSFWVNTFVYIMFGLCTSVWQYTILCLEDSVISIISPSSGGFPGPV